VTYTLDLSAPDHVAVTLRAEAPAVRQGLRVPLEWDGRGGLDKNIVIQEVRDASGREVAHSMERWTLRAEAKGALSVRYQVATRGRLDQETEGYPIRAAEYFLATGHPLFLHPEGWVESGEGRYRVDISPPAGWAVHTTAGQKPRIDLVGLTALRDLVIAAGDFRRAGDAAVDAGPALVTRGQWGWKDDDLLRPARAVFAESRGLLRWPATRYTVFLAPWPSAERRVGHSLVEALAIVAGERFDPGEPDTVSFIAARMARARMEGPLRRAGHSFFETLWFRDGVAAYYGIVLPIRAGQFPREHALERLQEAVLNAHRRDAVTDLRVYDLQRWYHWDERVARSIALKGAVVAFLLDARLRAQGKSLDGWLTYLEERFDGKRYSAADLAAAASDYTGADLTGFFRDHVTGIEPLPVERWLRDAGLTVSSEREDYPDFGMAIRVDDGQLRLHDVRQGGAAHRGGLREGDVVRDWYLPAGRFDLTAWVRVARAGGDETFRFSPDRARRDVFRLAASDPAAKGILSGMTASAER